MNTNISESIIKRQNPLIAHYHVQPVDAQITDCAKTSGGSSNDPFRGVVLMGEKNHASEVPFGVHKAVGGYHDRANPGDMLCGALAACLDASLRIIAGRFNVSFEQLEVEVIGHADVRGTLMVDKSVGVGFKKLHCNINIQPEKSVDKAVIHKIVKAAEHSCINLQTLLSGLAVETCLQLQDSQAEPEPMLALSS